MAREKKIDSVILGLLVHEPLTGYEIKKWMDRAIHYFWGGSYGNIYPALAKLEEEKKVTAVRSQENGREKITYSITEEGWKSLKEWLEVTTVKNELRYETLLKLFLGQAVGPETTALHIKEFEKNIKEELVPLRQYESVLRELMPREPEHRYYFLTVRFAIYSYEAYLEWCKEAMEVLEQAWEAKGEEE